MHRDDLPIETPCGVLWKDMEQASNTCRFCRTCSRPVVDLSAMTQRQARRLLARQPGVCISYLVDDEGTIAFRPAGDRSSTVSATAGMLALLAGCNQAPSTSTSSMSEAAAPAASQVIAVPAPTAPVEVAVPVPVPDTATVAPSASTPARVKPSRQWHRTAGIARL